MNRLLLSLCWELHLLTEISDGKQMVGGFTWIHFILYIQYLALPLCICISDTVTLFVLYLDKTKCEQSLNQKLSKTKSR